MKRLLALVLLLLPMLGAAETTAPFVLKVKPVLCVIDKRTPSCRVAFQIVWESDESGRYCVFNNFAEGALRCWRDHREGRHEDERSVSKTFRYWMTEDSASVRLAEVQVEVLRMNTDDRRRNRRTRHVWDIN